MFRTVPLGRSAWDYRRPVPVVRQPRFPRALSSPPPSEGLGSLLLKGAALVCVGALAYKGVQALFDEDFGTVEFPAWFRRDLIEAHTASVGSWCPGCRRQVRYGDLTIDHVVALANGGRTSRANAQVLCRDCNSAKGARNTLTDYLWGRSA